MTTISVHFLGSIRSYNNSRIDQEQTEDTTSKNKQTEIQNGSEEQLMEQQGNLLLLKLNQVHKKNILIIRKHIIFYRRIHSFHIL